jgi:hypothetical protein
VSMKKNDQSDFFQNLYNSGLSIVGARGTKGGGLPYVPTANGGSAVPQLNVSENVQRSPTQSENKQSSSSSSSMNPSQFLNQGAAPTSAVSTAPGGSSLVTGSMGSATYAPTGFGLAGASQGLTYGGSALGASSGLIGSAGGAASGAATGGAGFGLGGSLVGGTGAVGGSTFAAGSGGAAAAGGGAGGASAMFSNPWTALAAAIVGNEISSKKAGRRSDNDGQYAMDLLSGKVMEQDSDYYASKVGGVGGEIMKFGGQMGNPEGVFKNIKKLFGG